MASLGKIARRTFLFGAAAIAGGVAFGYYYYRKPYPNPLEGELAEGEATFNPYVKIAADNTITVIAPRAEMGQGVSTTLAALVAEELDVALDRIKVEHGPASWAYYNSAMLAEGGPFAFYNEGVDRRNRARRDGRRSARFSACRAPAARPRSATASTRCAQAGAAARQMLIAAAAAQLGVPAGELDDRERHDRCTRRRASR